MSWWINNDFSSEWIDARQSKWMNEKGIKQMKGQ